jgi:hypothetical protein
MKRTRFPLRFFSLAVLALALAGCAAQNVVPLTYPSTVDNAPWCRWDITVVAFQDQRPAPRLLGSLDEQTSYVPGSDVAEWATRAMFEEMKGRGCSCRYVATADNAGSGFVITGEVQQVQLDKVGLSTWKTQMKVRYTLTRNGEQLYAATHTGVVEKPIVLERDATSQIMAEGLQDITVQAVQAMIPAMEKVQTF